VRDWLPADHRVHKEWLGGVIEHVDKYPKYFHPVIKEFQQLIENDSGLYMLIQQMFDEVPKKKPYSRDPTGGRQVRDYQHMLALFNHLLTTAALWNNKGEQVGMVGLPLQAVLDWPMGTPSGFAAFQDP